MSQLTTFHSHLKLIILILWSFNWHKVIRIGNPVYILVIIDALLNLVHIRCGKLPSKEQLVQICIWKPRSFVHIMTLSVIRYTFLYLIARSSVNTHRPLNASGARLSLFTQRFTDSYLNAWFSIPFQHVGERHMGWKK